jgi:hypothetical protein
MLSIRIQDKEFNAALAELARTSRRTGAEVVTGQAIQILRALSDLTRLAERGRRASGKFFRPTMKGRARAGWWTAWKALGVFGVPKGTSAKVLALDEGSFKDGRKSASSVYVEMTNAVPYIGTLNSEDNILAGAYAGRLDDMRGAIERRFAREMAKRSGR